ncbi:30S ribosomal protein S9 [Paenibacillus polymyxa]
MGIKIFFFLLYCGKLNASECYIFERKKYGLKAARRAPQFSKR